MAKGSVVVRILSQWDDKGVKAAARDLGKAEKDFQGFANKVGKAFALAGAAAALFAAKIGVDAVKAAMEDQKSAALLANTLHNVVGTNDAVVASVEDFILKTELATGVLDDELRPAFSKLVATTHNVAQAQALLSLALDTSAGSGADLDSVSSALSKALNGNFGQLQRILPAMDKNIIKTKNFPAAIKFLADTYGGAAATRAATFAGQMDRLKVAFTEAKETLGNALLPALSQLTDRINTSIIPALMAWLNTNADKIAKSFATLVGYGVAFAKVLYDAFSFVARNIKVFAELGAVIVAALAGAKVAAAVSAVVGAILELIKVYKALRTATLSAAAAEALLTGGISAAAGAAAFAAALIGINIALKKFEKDAEKASQAAGGLKFDLNALKVSVADYLKGLTGLDTKTKNTTQSTKDLTAEQKKAIEVLAQLQKMGIVPRGETDPIELEAARLNLIKQNNLAEAERIAKMQQALIDQTNLNQAAQRYSDILQVLADSKISSEEVLVLAQKWGMTSGQVVEYIARIYAANSTDTSDAAIVKLYMAWGMTKEEAQKYLDFARALKDEKLDDSEIINLQHKWGLTKQEVLDYAKKVQDGTVFSATWADPGNAAKKSWEDALAALQAYIDKVKTVTGTAEPKASASAATAAATAAATTAAAAAAAATTAATAATVASAATSSQFALSVPAGFESTSLASQANLLSGARYEAIFQDIQSQNQKTNDLAAARYAAMQDFYSTYVAPTGANPAISNLAKRTGELMDIAALGTSPSAYTSVATSGTSGAGTTIIVQGNLVTQADNVAAIRNDLLNNQLSGKPMTFSAVAL